MINLTLKSLEEKMIIYLKILWL